MSLFEKVEFITEQIPTEYIAGAHRVDVRKLLALFEQRGILILRTIGSPNVGERTTDFERGRFAELQALYEILSTKS